MIYYKVKLCKTSLVNVIFTNVIVILQWDFKCTFESYLLPQLIYSNL